MNQAELSWDERLPENRGSKEHATVAAFLPWRGSRVDTPRPLTAWQGRIDQDEAQVDLPCDSLEFPCMGLDSNEYVRSFVGLSAFDGPIRLGNTLQGELLSNNLKWSAFFRIMA